MRPKTPVDFFISYNHHDRGFAEWIAWILEAERYRVVIQAWDFAAGGNFVLDMQKAASEAKRTIAVLSKYSLESGYVQAEWAAAFAKDPMGMERSLIPIRVGECTPQGLWAQIVYVDLVGVEEAEAEERVVQAANRAVTKERGKPSEKPEYPRSQIESKPVYPPSIPENLPRLSDVFVGRAEDLKKLHEQVKTGKPTAISAIAGMGGIGKTELAAQYASQQRDLGVYPGGVLWVSARTDLSEQMIEFARYQLQFKILEDVEPEMKVQDIWKQWQQKETLIVLDDVQDYGAIQRFLPPQRSYFKVLLTTRSRFGSPVQNYEIKVLSEAASLELLRSLVGDGRIDQDLDTAKRVCEWLGYLPLGLELVGRYLARKKGTSIAKLWERLQAQRLAAKALLEAESGMTASLVVVAAFELSWQELNEDAQRLAMLLSLFALAEIPWSLVQACLPEADEEELEDLRDQQLVNLSLLSFERDGMYQIHQLLREFFAVKRSTMPEEEAMKRSFCAVMSAVSDQMPIDWTLSSIEQFSATIPHLKEATTTLEPWLVDDDIYKPATRLGQFYQGQAAFAEAEEWYLHCRTISTQRLGESHPDVAMSLNNLALLYESQGRYEEAEPLYLQALELYRSLLGETHPDVAMSLNNLAGLYSSQGRYEEAEPLYLQALELYRSLLGETHPDVATSLNNLAGLYSSQGRYEEAEPLYLQALELSRTLLGETHPDVAGSLSNLAALYYSQGRYEEAEPLYLQALELYRSLLGETHPDVAMSLNNLALLYESQGRYEEAEPFYLQALELYRSLLGETHPDVAMSLNNLAGLYSSQGRYEEAEPLYLQALELSRTLLGETHPDVAGSLNNLALLYESQGRYEEAEPLYLQALELSRTLLGETHPDVAGSLSNLAALYYSQGRYEEAEPLYLQALELYRSLLGELHPAVATSLNNLALLYESQGRYEQAEPLYLQALSIFYQQLGADHPNTKTVWGNFIEFLQQVMQHDRTSELSDDPTTRSILQELQSASE